MNEIVLILEVTLVLPVAAMLLYAHISRAREGRIEKRLHNLHAMVNQLIDRSEVGDKGVGTSVEEKSETKQDKSVTAISREDQKFLTKLSELIRHELKAGRDANVRAVASEMCLSERQLHRKVSTLTGQSTIGYILRAKISMAQQMMEGNPRLNLSEVANRCGFNDYSSFVRAFRTFHNMAPRQFAEQLRR